MHVEAALLKGLRINAEITQRSVAERAKISEQWYRQIERDNVQPSLPVARDIAAALGCDLKDFCMPGPATPKAKAA